MRKIVSILLCFLLLSGTACGCGSQEHTEGGALSIVATIFPIYDWVREILGEEAENVSLTMLLDSGVDLHSYQPTAEDMIQIAACDVFIYVGGESDEWVEDALGANTKEGRIVINLLEALGDAAVEEETVEGMEAEAEDEDEDEPAYDEHIWLSLRNAQTLCQYISGRLSEADAAHSAAYAANTAVYLEALAALDEAYRETVAGAGGNTLLFGDRFPFRYLAEDYGLTYYAAFSGCSAETEASFETIAFLAEKLDELGLTAVLTIDGSDQRLAETIISTAENEGAEILTLHSMQSVTSRDAESGAAYLSIMEDNLAVLARALN